MEALFRDVSEAEEINVLYSLIKADPGFLLDFEEKQFVETPLHFAASEGREQLALEIQRLMPSLGMKLNGDGFSPLHLALQHGHVHTVWFMIKMNPMLVCVQGREGITPLHYAAETDNVDMLARFLILCPESIEKLTVRMETAAHVAVNARNLAAFKVLVGWMHKNDKGYVLRWTDWEGNTVLHLAAFINQPQFMEAQGKKFYLAVNLKNYRGLTALDIVMQLPDYNEDINGRRALSFLCSWRHRAKTGASVTLTPPADHLKSDESFKDFLIDQLRTERISSETRNAGLVVAALIASATYQVLLSAYFMNTGSGDELAPIILNVTSFHANNTTFPVVGLDVLKALGAHNLSNPDTVEYSEYEIALLMVLNGCALVSSIVVMIWLLAFQSFSILLLVSLTFLVMSASVMVSHIHFIVFYLILILGSLWAKLYLSILKREIKTARYPALP